MTFRAASGDRAKREISVNRRELLAFAALTACYFAGTGRAFGTSVDFIYQGVKAIVVECRIEGDAELVPLIDDKRLLESCTSFLSSSLRHHRPDIAVAYMRRYGIRSWPEGFVDRTTLQVFMQLTVRASENPKGYIGSTGLRLNKQQVVRGITWYPTEPFFAIADKDRLNEAASKALNEQLDDAIVQIYLKSDPNL